MKKFISVILAITILLAFSPLCLALTTGKYVVKKDMAIVYAFPNITSQKISELQKNTYIEITEIRNNTFGRVYVAKDNLSGWVQLSALEQVSEPVADPDVTGIKIKTLPSKLTYVDGTEELDLTGLSVVSINKNLKEIPLSGYSVFAPEIKTPGTKTITVSYSPDKVNTYSDSFTVTVTRLPVTAIELADAPTLSYKENRALDLSGLKISLKFSDSSQDKTYTYDEIKNNPDFIITGCHDENHGHILSAGLHTLRITYKYDDIFTELSVNVSERKLVSLSVKNEPDSLTVYSNTETPSLKGLVLEATYDNGDVEDVPYYNCKAVCDPSAFIIGPGNRVDVHFSGKYVSLYFRYSIATPEKISLQYPHDFTLIFLKGEEIDLSGIRVRLVYTDGSFEFVEDFKMSTPDPKSEGRQQITVTYKEFSEVFTIDISPYFSKGDVDGDGKISAKDARQVLRAAVKLTSLSGMTFFAGDADRNDEITSNDARLILRASVKLENLYVTI